MFSGNGVRICLPATGNALGAAGSAGESVAIPVAAPSPRENPQTEPSGGQAARRSYRRWSPPTWGNATIFPVPPG